MKNVSLKPGREKSLKRRHPWIFTGAIAQADDDISAGETVAVKTAAGATLATGAYSPDSQIRVRIWSFDPDKEINRTFFESAVEVAIARRTFIDPDEVSAYRVINAESDGLPGLVVDRYSDYLVCQFLSAGAEFWKTTIVEILRERLQPAGIYERSDTAARKKEGLSPQTGLLSGEEPPEKIEILENGGRFFVDVRGGQKTGFYLDQRLSRQMLRSLAKDSEVLNAFAYSGSFAIAALRGGASRIVNIESANSANLLAQEHLALNGFDVDCCEIIQQDVFKQLRFFRDARRQFDIVILDPPKFAESASQLQRAGRAYKDINLLAIKLLRPGGLLFTFSCSGHVVPALFQKIVADAAQDAGRHVTIRYHLHQAEDHPVALNFPEGLYLKGLVCRVD